MPALPQIGVLVVENNAQICAMLTRALRCVGLATDVAATVVETKRLLCRGAYKVLVLDLILEDGTGHEVLDFIRRERLPSMHIIVITAAVEMAAVARLDRSLVNAVLLKPFDPDDFVAGVQAAAINGAANHTKAPHVTKSPVGSTLLTG
jgi:DNA-binding response OmpR family regulator